MRLTLDELRNYCLRKSGDVSEGLPFGDGALVFKVRDKMFALAMLDSVPLSVNLKCDPELAVELRERYEAVQPGYHMNKKHWITVQLDGTIPVAEVYRMVDASYALVAGKGSGETGTKRRTKRRGKIRRPNR